MKNTFRAKFNKILVWFTIFVLSGCATVAVLDGTQPILLGPDESIVVLGVKPDCYIEIAPGVLKENGVFRFNIPMASIGNTYLFKPPTNNRIVAKLHANKEGEYYAIENFSFADKSGIFGTTYVPRGGSQIIIFQVLPGKTLYVGDFEYQLQKTEYTSKPVYTTSFHMDVSEVEKYMAEQFPKLGKVEALPAKKAWLDYIPTR